MFVDFSRLDDGRLSTRFEIERESPVLDGFEAEVREPVILEVEVRSPSGGTYVLTGRLSGIVVLACRRCLQPTAIPLDVPFRILYQDPGRDAERSEESGDDDVVWLDRGATRIELDDQVRDLLFLETERFPLCRPDCKGFCPQCGQNFNEGACDCTLELADARWKALEGLHLGEAGD